MPEKRPLWLVVVLLGLLPAWAAGQERQQLTLEAGAPVTVYADRIENLEREQLLIAEGNVELQQGDVRLEADRMEVNSETGETVATGRVVLFDGRDRLTGDRIEYNLRTATGIVYRAEGAVEPHFFFTGDRMERFGDKAYRIASGVFTTCEDESPAWSVRLGSATAYLDDWMWGTNASFWVWKIPVVPFIPFFATSLRKDRHSGLLTPTFGTSSVKGFYFRQPVYFVLSDSQDLTVAPSYFEKRGFGLSAAYRYVRTESSRGEFSGFYLHDTEDAPGRDNERGVVTLRHEEFFTPRLVLRADVNRVSDRTFLSEFGDTLDERSRQRLESNVSLTQRWDKWNFVGRLFVYQDLTTDQPVELQRLPELRLTAFQQPVPWVRDMLFDLDSSYVNFVRDLGSDGQRLDLHPRLSYPVSPGGFFTITPRLGLRETFYDTKVVGTTVDRGVVVEDTRQSLTARSIFEAGADFEARAYRVFDLNGAMGIQRLQHVIEPRASYNFSTGDDSTDLPQWDAIDAIRPAHTVTYSLTNRLKARAVGEEDRPGRVWEVVRFTLSQTYTVEPEPLATSVVGTPAPPPTTTPPTGPVLPPTTATAAARRRATARQTPADTGVTTVTTVTPPRLSDVLADLILEPVYGVRFRGTASFNPYEAQVTGATTDLVYEAENWRVGFGTRHGTGGELDFIQAAVEAKIGRRWVVRVSSDYSVATGTVIENRFEVDFREQCWWISAAFIDRSNEDEFRITINLLELGQYGFGRAFAGYQ
ncbi:MAG TPA: LPS assembly protein LptD [Methylomirabilota bacterium]|nr:LPS assembly protein LptD [Methylomirabilota bacterium]